MYTLHPVHKLVEQKQWVRTTHELADIIKNCVKVKRTVSSSSGVYSYNSYDIMDGKLSSAMHPATTAKTV